MPGVTTPSLRELQEWMRWAVTDPRGVEAALRHPHPPELGGRYQAPARDASSALKAPASGELETRLAVYAEAYFHRLLASLEEDFPTTVRFLGQEDFARLINDYLKTHPSRSFTLADAGRDLPAFAARTRGDEPWLSQLLELEWRMIESFYSPAACAMAPEALAETPADADWAQAQIRFVPGLFVVENDWPAARLRTETLDRDAFKSELGEKSFILVHRLSAGAVALEDLTPGEAACLRALMNGLPLEEALQEAAALLCDSLNETLIGAWFARWTHLGLIQRIDFPKL